MKIKTSELTGLPLTFALAKAIGVPLNTSYTIKSNSCIARTDQKGTVDGPAVFGPVDWKLVGPLRDKYQIDVMDFSDDDDPYISAAYTKGNGLHSVDGPTAIIAICRAVVAFNLGYQVDVPDELVQGGAV